MVTKNAPKKKVQKNPERSKKDAFDILDGRIKIYRTASKVWQMQTWIKEEQKYVRESCWFAPKSDPVWLGICIEIWPTYETDPVVIERAG